jgi:hypothetical protein
MRKFRKNSIITTIFGSLGLLFLGFCFGIMVGMMAGKDMQREIYQLEQIQNDTMQADTLQSDTINYKKIVAKLCELESGNNPDTIGDNGLAFGILQFHAIAVQEHNNQFNTNYTHKDAFNAEISKLMCENLLRLGAEKHYQKCGVEANESDIVRMHKGSIYGGANKANTIEYLRRYYEIS